LKRLHPEQLGSLVDEKVRTAIEYFAECLAHDFNNIITPLLAYPDILAPLLPDERCVKLIRSMQESAQHALEVTQRLTALAGGGQTGPQTFDMSAVTAEAVAAVKKQLERSDHVVIRDSLSQACSITMQQEAFVRALEALLENAIRAVGSQACGGTVTVVAENVRIDCMSGVGGEHIPEGVYHSLSVTDTGPGMTAEDMRHIIEPFVTGLIKNPGCGAGLGLSVAYCGLRRNGAYLQIESGVQKGTRATMYFPIVRSGGAVKAETAPQGAAATPAQCAPEQENGPVGRKEQRVLVVDDEHSILNLFKMILENFIPGIVVDRADNGVEAVDVFKQGRHPVLVMDLHMPVMDGQSAFFEIERYCRQNDIPMPAVIFCTGYAPQAPLRQAIGAQQHHLMLNKPVQSHLLVRAVRERLEAVATA